MFNLLQQNQRGDGATMTLEIVAPLASILLMVEGVEAILIIDIVEHPYAQLMEDERILKWMEGGVRWITWVEKKGDVRDPNGEF